MSGPQTLLPLPTDEVPHPSINFSQVEPFVHAIYNLTLKVRPLNSDREGARAVGLTVARGRLGRTDFRQRHELAHASDETLAKRCVQRSPVFVHRACH